jgi:hypothetical protein
MLNMIREKQTRFKQVTTLTEKIKIKIKKNNDI